MSFNPTTSEGSGGGGGGGVVQQGARDATVQPWYVDNQPGDTLVVDQGTPPWQVVGNVASGVADSGNPVKAGAIYNSIPPSRAVGQRTDLQTDSLGHLKVILGTPDSATYIANTVPSDGIAGVRGVTVYAQPSHVGLGSGTWSRSRGADADNITAAGAVAGIAAAGMMAYDPVALSMNRVRADTTNGLWVQIKDGGPIVTSLSAISTLLGYMRDTLNEIALTAILQREALETHD